MLKTHNPQRLNLQAFAQAAEPLEGSTPPASLDRLAAETDNPSPDGLINWRVAAELRPVNGSDDQVWMHLQGAAVLPLVCQRCMGSVDTPVAVDQWYRFVATEEIAMAEDDQSDEDLLVLEPHFDVLALLEDELLMALPLVPMHGECPAAPPFSAGDLAEPETGSEMGDKPHPFAVLASLQRIPAKK